MSTAIVMYGPPAAGKDTVTSALCKLDSAFHPYQRVKIGRGRTEGYRMASSIDLRQMEAANEVIYTNHRYGATYVIDRPEISKITAAGDVPVIHVGQPEAIGALLAAIPEMRWVVVELWCPRDVAAERIAARDTGDTDERLAAWDATPKLATTDVRIDTSAVDPRSAAHEIVAAVRAAQGAIVVPTMHLVHEDGTLDRVATRQHAQAAATGWTDLFLINGSTTAGDELTSAERVDVLDIWLNAVDASRLLACAWSHDDLQHAADRGITPMVVLKANSRGAAERLLEALPDRTTIYSHPMFGYTFNADLAAWARGIGRLPKGGKLAKIELTEISEILRTVPEFDTWDGSSRRIQESANAGAAGVVATPLSAVLGNLPSRNLALIQSTVDSVQMELDRLPDRPAKRRWLVERIRAATLPTV
ncbi:hypothetical protein ACTD5D_31025 [Nocardia takedensis]|uniref:hypothetical protein n=1 Tax=Nocardia takedensis TaxID=259390 RepID=UPI003F761B4C